MKLAVMEIKKYYSNKAVRNTYICVIFPIFILEYLFDTEKEFYILAPALAVQGLFGAVFGIICVFLMGKIWENDLSDGTIKNIFSAGVSRGKWFITKLKITITQCFTFTALTSFAGMIIGLSSRSKPQGYSWYEIIIKNMQSFLVVISTALVYGAISTLIFLIIKNFRFALLVAMTVPFFECIVSLLYLVDKKMVFLPTAFLDNLYVAIEENKFNDFNALFLKGMISMLLVFLVVELVALRKCLKCDF